MSLEEAFEKIVKSNQLLTNNDRVLIAFSAGPDSLSLYYLIKLIKSKFNLTIALAHVDYHLRGKESDIEAKWIKDFADTEDVILYQKDGSIVYKSNLQEKAREIRYSFFEEVFQREKYTKLALGHHQDDQIETFIIRLLRASSVDSLSCMSLFDNRNFLTIIRPLLYFTKSQLVDFLQSRGYHYFIDSSNLKDDYLRNKIRNRLIPEINNVESNYRNQFQNIIELIQEQNNFVSAERDRLVNKLIQEDSDGNIAIPITDFKKVHNLIQKQIILKVCRNLESTKDSISKEELLEILVKLDETTLHGSIQLYKKASIEIVREYDNLKIIENKRVQSFLPIKIEDFNEKYKIFENIKKKSYLKFFIKKASKISFNQCDICLDRDKIRGNMYLKHFQKGDAIHLNDKIKNKKLSDIFIDKKIPKNKRSEVVLIFDDSKIIAFILEKVLNRLSSEYYISESTKDAICIEYIEVESNI